EAGERAGELRAIRAAPDRPADRGGAPGEASGRRAARATAKGAGDGASEDRPRTAVGRDVCRHRGRPQPRGHPDGAWSSAVAALNGRVDAASAVSRPGVSRTSRACTDTAASWSGSEPIAGGAIVTTPAGAY